MNSEAEATVLFVETVLKISKDYEVAIHEGMNKGGEDEGKSHSQNLSAAAVLRFDGEAFLPQLVCPTSSQPMLKTSFMSSRRK